MPDSPFPFVLSFDQADTWNPPGPTPSYVDDLRTTMRVFTEAVISSVLEGRLPAEPFKLTLTVEPSRGPAQAVAS